MRRAEVGIGADPRRPPTATNVARHDRSRGQLTWVQLDGLLPLVRISRV